MKVLFIVGLLLIAAIGVAAVLSKRPQKGRTATGALNGKTPLTEREQSMYFRLAEVFPEQVVLAQVAFSALLATKDRPTRATFDKKVADFVLCTRAFGVVAVIELDDASHKGRESSDKARDEMLTAAGYRVVRFAQVPNRADALKALSPLNLPT